MIEPIEIDFTVACDREHAFDVWTSRTTLWWPVEHTVSAAPGVAVTFEPRGGGRIFERTPAGDEHEWGEVLAWEPPRLLRYRWHIRRERARTPRRSRSDSTTTRKGRGCRSCTPAGSASGNAVRGGAR
jgi:uncharacterized protein YndB with AHSA1/START domain